MTRLIAQSPGPSHDSLVTCLPMTMCYGCCDPAWPGIRSCKTFMWHDDVIKWKHFQRYWPFVRGIHRSPVNSPHKGQWRGAFDVFFNLRLNKRLSKQSRGWLFETLSCPLWRHCNGSVAISNHASRVLNLILPWNDFFVRSLMTSKTMMFLWCTIYRIPRLRVCRNMVVGPIWLVFWW